MSETQLRLTGSYSKAHGVFSDRDLLSISERQLGAMVMAYAVLGVSDKEILHFSCKGLLSLEFLLDSLRLLGEALSAQV